MGVRLAARTPGSVFWERSEACWFGVGGGDAGCLAAFPALEGEQDLVHQSRGLGTQVPGFSGRAAGLVGQSRGARSLDTVCVSWFLEGHGLGPAEAAWLTLSSPPAPSRRLCRWSWPSCTRSGTTWLLS